MYHTFFLLGVYFRTTVIGALLASNRFRDRGGGQGGALGGRGEWVPASLG